MSIASEIRDEVKSAPIGTWFVVKDLTERYGTRAAVDLALSRTAKDGELIRVRRGLYWKGTKTRFGITSPNTFSIGLGVLESLGIISGVGPTGWSASQALGLSTQIPTETHLVVSGRPPAPVAGIKYHSRSSHWRGGLHPLEVALLEVLRDFPFRVEADWEELVDRMLKLHKSQSLDIKKVSSVCEKESHTGARSRARELAARVEKMELVDA